MAAPVSFSRLLALSRRQLQGNHALQKLASLICIDRKLRLDDQIIDRRTFKLR